MEKMLAVMKDFMGIFGGRLKFDALAMHESKIQIDLT